jgi:Spy/CpxP family protein refolding chaperone
MKFKIYILSLCFLSILATSPSFSQPLGMKPGPRMREKSWKGEGPCWRASELNLSLDQVKRLELIQQAFFRETQLPRAELFAKRLELREFLTNPTIKVESIRSKYLEIKEIQSKLEEKTLEYLMKVRNVLTEEQLKIWCPEQEFPFFRRMMQGPGPMGIMPPRKPPFPEGPRKE